jgi:hypothetical protein
MWITIKSTVGMNYPLVTITNQFLHALTNISLIRNFSSSSAAALKNAISPVRHVNPSNSRVGVVALSRHYIFRNVAQGLLE